jgi:hypothetical protein
LPWLNKLSNIDHASVRRSDRPAGGNENTLVSDKLSPNSTTAPNTREHEHKPGPWASNRKFKLLGTKYAKLAI